MKTVFINDTATTLPDNVTNLEELLAWKGIPAEGTAVALNDRLIIARNRAVTAIANGDRITIISATFGG